MRIDINNAQNVGAAAMQKSRNGPKRMRRSNHFNFANLNVARNNIIQSQSMEDSLEKSLYSTIDKRALLTGVIFVMIVALIFICGDLRITASIISIIGSFVLICRSLQGWPSAETLDSKKKDEQKKESAPQYYDVDDPLPIISKAEIEERDMTLLPVYVAERQRGDFYSDEYVGEKGPISEIIDSNILQEPLVGQKEGKERMDNYNKPHLLQRQWDMHESYNTPFMTLAPIRGLGDPEADQSMDTANTRMVRARTRDQRCLTGAVLKDANYFKRFYGEEFSESEGKRWWGRDDY